MKHVKLFEEFISSSSLNEAEDLEKKLAELAKKEYEIQLIGGMNEYNDDPEQAKLKYQAALLSHKGDSAGAEKIKNQIQARHDSQRDKYRSLEKELNKLKDAVGDPKAARAAHQTAFLQAKIKSLTELAKIYQTLSTKAGKEISEAKQKAYEEKAKYTMAEVKETQGELPNAMAEYKKTVEKLKGGSSEESEKEEMSARELANYVWKNWKKITGLKASERDQEGHFPEEVVDLLKKNNVDYIDFSDAWTEIGDLRR